MHTLEFQEAVEVLQLQKGTEHQTLLVAGLFQYFKALVDGQVEIDSVSRKA
jgi:hypothetical protein